MSSDSENRDSNSDAAKDAALKMKEDAEKAFDEIKGRGIMGFFSFDQLYFPIVARYVFIILCVLSIVGIVLGVLGSLFTLVTGNILAGFSGIIGSIIFGIVGLLVLRIWFEMFLVAFKINENLEKIREKTC